MATGTTKQAPNYPPSAWLKSEDWPFAVMADARSARGRLRLRRSARIPYFVFVDAEGKVAGRGDAARSRRISSEGRHRGRSKAGQDLRCSRQSRHALCERYASAAALAHADEVEAVVLRAEPGGARSIAAAAAATDALEPGRRGDVLDARRTTRR